MNHRMMIQSNVKLAMASEEGFMDKSTIVSSVREKLFPAVKARATELASILCGMYSENKKAREAGAEYPHKLSALFIPARNAFRGAFDPERLNDGQLVALASLYKALTVEDKIRLRAAGAVAKNPKKKASFDLDALEAALKEDSIIAAKKKTAKK